MDAIQAFSNGRVRVTNDGLYASAIDILREIGLGNPTRAWSEYSKEQLYGRICPASGAPVIKSYQFDGKGQRYTPVLSAEGIVMFLLSLPGKAAMDFRTGAGVALIRQLGGDERLIEEISRNREIAESNPASAQAFMRRSQHVQKQTVTSDTSIETLQEIKTYEFRKLKADVEEKEHNNIRLARENFLALKDFASSVDDPRFSLACAESAMNGIAELYGIKQNVPGRDLIADEIHASVPNSAEPTHWTVESLLRAELPAERLCTAQKAKLGKLVKDVWKFESGGLGCESVPKLVCGEVRSVNAYPASFKDRMLSVIRANVARV